jgi:hypothetical protein
LIFFPAPESWGGIADPSTGTGADVSDPQPPNKNNIIMIPRFDNTIFIEITFCK